MFLKDISEFKIHFKIRVLDFFFLLTGKRRLELQIKAMEWGACQSTVLRKG